MGRYIKPERRAEVKAREKLASEQENKKKRKRKPEDLVEF